MKMQLQHKFANIYDRLNEQPQLQEIIKSHYYAEILRDQAKENNVHVIDQLNYAYSNAKKHQKELYGGPDDDNMLDFMKENGNFSEIIRTTNEGKNIKYGLKGVFNDFYGNSWVEFYYWEYLYNDELGF